MTLCWLQRAELGAKVTGRWVCFIAVPRRDTQFPNYSWDNYDSSCLLTAHDVCTELKVFMCLGWEVVNQSHSAHYKHLTTSLAKLPFTDCLLNYLISQLPC